MRKPSYSRFSVDSPVGEWLLFPSLLQEKKNKKKNIMHCPFQKWYKDRQVLTSCSFILIESCFSALHTCFFRSCLVKMERYIENKACLVSLFPLWLRPSFQGGQQQHCTLSTGGWGWSMWSQLLMGGVSPAELVQINQTLKFLLNT